VLLSEKGRNKDFFPVARRMLPTISHLTGQKARTRVGRYREKDVHGVKGGRPFSIDDWERKKTVGGKGVVRGAERRGCTKKKTKKNKNQKTKIRSSGGLRLNFFEES